MRLAAWAALGIAELLLAGAGTIVPVPVERVTRSPRILEPVLAATADNGVRPRIMRLARTGDDTALYFLPPNLDAYWGVEDLDVYEPLPAARMEELFRTLEPDAPGKPSVALNGAGVLALFRPESLRHPLLDLLDCRFVLSARDDLALPNLVDRTPAGVPRPFRLYERTRTLPRATFCDRAEVVADHDARLALLGDPKQDPRATTVLEDPNAPPASGDGTPDADVEIVAHTDERVTIHVVAREPGYLRLADPWDPGWTATVDGEARPVFIADHYLRAVHLAPGDHVVKFAYDGPVVFWPRLLGAAGAAIALGLILAGVLARHRRMPQHRAAPATLPPEQESR